MPPAIAAIAGVIAATTGASIATATVIATVLLNVGVSAGLGLLERLLQTKPTMQTRVTTREAISARRTIYGFYHGPGAVTYLYVGVLENVFTGLTTTSNGWLFQVHTMAGHECAQIGDLYLDKNRVLVDIIPAAFGSATGWITPQGQLVTAGILGDVLYRSKRGGKDFPGALFDTVGTSNQGKFTPLTPLDLATGTAVEDQSGLGTYQIAARLNSGQSLYVLPPPAPNQEWDDTCRQEGCASVGVGLYRSDVFNGLPSVWVDIWGKKIVDPRSLAAPQVGPIYALFPSQYALPSGGWYNDGFAEYKTLSGYGGNSEPVILDFSVPSGKIPPGSRITGLKVELIVATGEAAGGGGLATLASLVPVPLSGSATPVSDATGWQRDVTGDVFFYGNESDTFGLTQAQLAAMVASGTISFEMIADLVAVTAGAGAFLFAGCNLTIYIEYEPVWQASTAYVLGALVVDSNGYLQQVTTAGTSGGAPPAWNTAVGGTTSDGGVTWTNQGTLADYLAANAATLAFWSQNAALCHLDYLVTPRQLGGFGASWDEIDLDLFIAAANVCDETVGTAPVSTTVKYLDLVSQGGSTPWIYQIIPTSMRGILPGLAIIVGSGADAESTTVIETSGNSFTAVLLNGNTNLSLPQHQPGEPITAPEGSEPRYAANGSFNWDEDPVQIMANLLSAFAGVPTYIDGKYGVYAGAWGPPSVTLTDADLRAPVKLQSLRSARDLCNGVRGTFVNASNNWQPDDFPLLVHKIDPTNPSIDVDNDLYLAQDGGYRRWKELQLPFTTSSSTALRLASIALEKNRRQKTLTWPGKMSCYQVTPPDVIQISRTSGRWNLNGSTYQVLNSRLVIEAGKNEGDSPTLGADLTLQEVDANIYAWDPVSEQVPATAIPTGLPSSGSGVETVTEIALAPTAPGAFTVPHDLGFTPAFVTIQMTSGGQIWLNPSSPPDATNLYLIASDAGVTGNAQLWTVAPDEIDSPAPSAPGAFTLLHSLGQVPSLVVLCPTSGGLVALTGYDSGTLSLIASLDGITAKAGLWRTRPLVNASTQSRRVLVASAAGEFTVPHGLGATPVLAVIVMASNGSIWFQPAASGSPLAGGARYDATNLYLVGSEAGVTASIEVWA